MNNLITIAFLFTSFGLYAQSISGQLGGLANQTIQLHGFNGFTSYNITQTQADAKGNFSLNFPAEQQGVGYLIGPNQKPYFIILAPENIGLYGQSLAEATSIEITEGQQNQWFAQYAGEQPKREQALVAWQYMQGLYQDMLFHPFPKSVITQEVTRLKVQDSIFIAKLPQQSYVRWYLPIRKLVSSVSSIAQYRPAEIPATIAAFRKLNYADNRLYQSGLLKEAIESHFWLLENSGLSLDSIATEMKLSIEIMVNQLIADETKLNEITDYLFDLLERQSLFQASEHLALKVLNETSCTINSDLAKQLETYRAMKKGAIAANLNFGKIPLVNNADAAGNPKQLSDIQSTYTLVVFGASWCPKCQQEVPQIAQNYAQWKSHGVEVVFVSLDEEEKAFQQFTATLPFMSVCDLKKWESPLAQDFYVFGTPTMYLLNNNLTIELRPNSLKQMEAWVDWFLVKNNQNLNN